MKKLNLLFVFLLAFTFQSFSQDFEVPKDYTLDKAEDYAQYEQDVIDGVTWAIETPAGENTSKRKKVYKFLFTWMLGSPNVTLILNPDVAPFIDNPDLMLIYMGGWTKYALETKDFKDEFKGTMAGIHAVITFYEKNVAVIGKNKHVKKYIKMKSKGKLKAHVKSKMG